MGTDLRGDEAMREVRQTNQFKRDFAMLGSHSELFGM